jgi:hypothetical protein
VELINQTPYAAERAITMNRDAAEILIVAVKGTWNFTRGGEMELAEIQAPIGMMDEYAGDPAETSIVSEFELGLPKPSTNVVLLGSARPERRGVREMPVTLHVGPIRKTAMVTGRRRWLNSFGFPRASKPEPIDELALVWENSYGGSDLEAKAWEPLNPVGRGFRGKKSKLPVKDAELPNVEHPKQRLTKPTGKSIPWGFGFVAPFWEPRRSRAGTYDDAWMKDRAPLLPEDFQDTFHHSVSDDQVVPRRFRGDEEIEVVNVRRAGPLRGRVPRGFPVASVLFGGSLAGLPLPLDTVIVDADAEELRLVWKGALNVHRRSLKIQAIKVDLAASRKGEV